LNHRLRGAESDRDEELVRSASCVLELALHIERADPSQLTAPGRDGLEAAARQARYAFLRSTAESVGARYVTTAHTADDQAETILHRIARGTGLAGLAGMPRARPLGDAATLIRPLLGIRRREVLDYLRSHGTPFRHDASNHDLTRTRNVIRHQVLPQLEASVHPQATDSLLRLGRLAAEAEVVLGQLVSQLFDRCIVRQSDGSVVIDAGQLEETPPYLIRELLIALWRTEAWPRQAMGFEQWDRLAALLTQPEQAGPRHRLPGKIEVVRQDRRWVVRRVE
ncbi:MAG: tRNA lysidine(34) synthetase TilS, partial [Pirellulales bacterium]